MKRTFTSKRLVWSLSIIVLILSITTTRAFSPKKAGFFFDEGKISTILNFQLVHNLIIVPVEIQGKKLNLILDTGMNSIVLFGRSSIKDLSRYKNNRIEFSGLGSGPSLSGYRVDDISVNLPGIHGVGLSLVVLKNRPFQATIDNIKIDGIFGYQVFSKFIVEIDYLNNTLKLTKNNHFIPPLNAVAIPIEIKNTKPYINALAAVNNRSMYLRLLIDTGAATALLLQESKFDNLSSRSTLKQIGTGFSGRINGRSVDIYNFELGTHKIFRDFEAYVVNESTYPVDSEVPRDGTLGNGILKHYKVIFNYFDSVLYLEAPKKEYHPVIASDY